jgi:transposase-like protein
VDTYLLKEGGNRKSRWDGRTLTTRVATLFPNPQSCEILVRALLVEKDEEWMSGKIYLNMKP